MIIFMRFPEGRERALTLSYDDGNYQDIRLMEILDRNGIKCTFNLNSSLFTDTDAVGHGKLSVKQAKQLYTNSPHEVAVHTATHTFLEQLPVNLALDEVLTDRKSLEKNFGKIVRGMAYPFGSYNDDVINALKAAGIVYARTCVSTNSFAVPTDWLKMPTTCHHSSSNLMKLCDDFLGEQRHKRPRLFYLWGHSYEFDDNDNWYIIENFAKKMGKRDNVWYATNIEIYDYVDAFHRLVFTADSGKVYNPSCIPVWFYIGGFSKGEIIRVEPGETKVL